MFIADIAFSNKPYQTPKNRGHSLVVVDIKELSFVVSQETLLRSETTDKVKQAMTHAPWGENLNLTDVYRTETRNTEMKWQNEV